MLVLGLVIALVLPPSADPPRWTAALHVTDATLLQTVERVAEASPVFRASLDSVALLGRTVLLLTLDEVIGVEERFAREGIAETAPVARPDSSVDAVMVVLNLSLLQKTYERAGAPHDVLERDLQRIIIHEVYGHAVPYLLAGHLRGACPDPKPEAEPGCSIVRENEIRAEAGLGIRTGYDLRGLEIARYLR